MEEPTPGTALRSDCSPRDKAENGGKNGEGRKREREKKEGGGGNLAKKNIGKERKRKPTAQIQML